MVCDTITVPVPRGSRTSCAPPTKLLFHRGILPTSRDRMLLREMNSPFQLHKSNLRVHFLCWYLDLNAYHVDLLISCFQIWSLGYCFLRSTLVIASSVVLPPSIKQPSWSKWKWSMSHSIKSTHAKICKWLTTHMGLYQAQVLFLRTLLFLLPLLMQKQFDVIFLQTIPYISIYIMQYKYFYVFGKLLYLRKIFSQ